MQPNKRAAYAALLFLVRYIKNKTKLYTYTLRTLSFALSWRSLSFESDTNLGD